MTAVRMLWVGIIMAFFFTWVPARAQEAPQRASSLELVKRSFELINHRFGSNAATQLLSAWPYEGTDGKRAVCGEARYRPRQQYKLTTARFAAWGTEVVVETDETFAEIYGARCFTRLPDDGTIAQDQAFQNRFAPELGVKGNRIGTARWAMPTTDSLQCSSSKVVDELCSFASTTVAGVGATSFSLQFFDGHLHGIQVGLDHSGYGIAKRALVEKFGEPKVRLGSFTNAMGATFTGETLTWTLMGGFVELEERFELTKSLLLVRSEDFAELTAKQRKQNAARNAADL